MPLNDLVPGSTIASQILDDNFNGLADGSNDAASNSMGTFRSEAAVNFVYIGLVWTQTSGLIGTMTAGTAYVKGVRVAPSTIASHTFTASKDTYIDINTAGVLTYVEVTNGASSPALTSNSIRIAKVVTNGSAITSVTQNSLDSLGNYVYNTSPWAQPITQYANPGSAGGTFFYRTQNGIKEFWGATNQMGVAGSGFQNSSSLFVTFPVGFFNSLSSVNLSAGAAVNSNFIWAVNIANSTSSLQVQIAQANGGSGAAVVHVYVRGY